MDIMNMTLGQILHSLTSNMLVDFAILSGLLNFEAIVRQVAVNKGYKGVVSLCDKVARAITFALDILEAVGKKQPPKAVPVVLLCVGLMFATGCISGKASLSGTGIDVHDPTHAIEAQANSINAEVDVNATRPNI